MLISYSDKKKKKVQPLFDTTKKWHSSLDFHLSLLPFLPLLTHYFFSYYASFVGKLFGENVLGW